MKVVDTKDRGFCIEGMTFSEITNLLMTLKHDVHADMNSDCYYNRQNLIKKIDKCVYGISKNSQGKK